MKAKIENDDRIVLIAEDDDDVDALRDFLRPKNKVVHKPYYKCEASVMKHSSGNYLSVSLEPEKD